MKRFAAAFALLLTTFTFVLPLHAAEGDGKKAGKKKKADAAAVAGDETFVGDLCVKPKGAGDGVVCGLISRQKGKEEIYLLKADGELAKQIAEMRQNGMRAKVTGALNEKTLTVHSIAQNVPKK
jgi:hypothetical protein